MRIQSPLILAASLSALSAHAGTMNAGMWEITSTVVSAAGPGIRPTMPKAPLVSKSCLTQAFVDRENYTNPEFSLNRLKRGKFECKVDSKTGDVRQATWAASCTREDGFSASFEGSSTLTATTLAQTGAEHIKKGDELWTLIRIRIDAKYLGDKCDAGVIVVD